MRIFDKRSFWLLSVLTGLALVFLGGITSTEESLWSLRPGTMRSKLIKVFGPIRPCEARLTGVPYSPFESSPVAVVLKSRARINELARRAQSLEDRSSRDLADSAVLSLFNNNPGMAVLKLETAIHRDAKDGGLLSDLSASRLAVYEAHQNPLDLLRALAAADQAVRYSPELPEAKFNLALSLQRLLLYDSAREVWNQYLDLDPSSRWSAEARQKIVALDGLLEPPKGFRKEFIENEPLQARLISEIVKAYPQESRTWIQEEILSYWAAAAFEGRITDMKRAGGIARVVGRSLAEREGDWLIIDTVEVIDKALLSGSKLRTRLLEGHLEYGEGVKLFREGQPAKALDRFLRASTLLSESGSPFRGWAIVHAANCNIYDRRSRRALRLLAICKECQNPARYPMLVARSEWLYGLAKLRLAEWAESLRSYRSALNRFLLAGERENTAAMHFNVAESLRIQGRFQEAWRHRLEALRIGRSIDKPIWFHNALFDAAESARVQGMPRLALYFQDEMVSAAEALANPILASEALLRRARSRHELGIDTDALRDLDHAEYWISLVAAKERQQSIHAEVVIARSEIIALAFPGEASDLLAEAIDYFKSHESPFRLPALFRAKAELEAKLGKFLESEKYYLAGIEESEFQRARAEPGDLRISFFDQQKALFDGMIDLQAEHLGRAGLAFAFHERSHSRELLQILAKDGGATGCANGDYCANALRNQLPLGKAILEYRVSNNKLFIWLLAPEKIYLQILKFGRSDLERRVEALYKVLASRSEDDLDTALGEWYAILIEPFQDELARIDTLAIVPDGILYKIPFAALKPQGSRSFLIKARKLIIMPSASIFEAAVRAGPAMPPVGLPKALIIGDPAIPSQLRVSLTQLSGAREQAERMASLYLAARVLIGAAATRQAVIDLADDYEILHFGTHAFASDSLVGGPAIVLAVKPGEDGEGLLHADNIAALRLVNTRVVILAACDSATGKISEMEGIFSLVRPFLLAGSPAVIASLWKVEDRAAGPLHLILHRELAAGRGPASALRAAQIWASEALSVRQWAAFELFGGASFTLKEGR